MRLSVEQKLRLAHYLAPFTAIEASRAFVASPDAQPKPVARPSLARGCKQLFSKSTASTTGRNIESLKLRTRLAAIGGRRRHLAPQLRKTLQRCTRLHDPQRLLGRQQAGSKCVRR